MKKIKIAAIILFIIDILIMSSSYLFCSMKWKHTISKETLKYYHIGLALKNIGIITAIIISLLIITMFVISIFHKYKHK